MPIRSVNVWDDLLRIEEDDDVVGEKADRVDLPVRIARKQKSDRAGCQSRRRHVSAAG
jgi:hypothetical protein